MNKPVFSLLDLILSSGFVFGVGFFLAMNDWMHNAFFVQNFYLVVIIGVTSILCVIGFALKQLKLWKTITYEKEDSNAT